MKKKHTKILIAILGFIVAVSWSMQLSAQNSESGKSAEGKLSEVAQMLEGKEFEEAITLSYKLMKQYPSNPDVYLLMGLGYINVGNKADSAQIVLNKGLELLSADEKFSESGINIHLSLAKAYQMNLQPQKSIDIYKQLIGKIPADSLLMAQEINHEIQTCENAKLYLANPIALTINNLGPNVNSKFDEHTPLISYNGQKLVYTSRRQHAGLSKLDDGQYPEKIYFSNNANQIWSGSESTNTFYKRNDHESAVSISANGKQMFLFKSDLDGKNLYVSEMVNNTWGEPKKLPEPINSYSHETHCSLSADGSTLFFTSDREGGFGGLDIYMCKKLENGTWGEARNLGANINTSFNEETPMVFLDGKTLYFASEGHTSMGMYDIFYACMQPDSAWSEPINLGYPINSPADDLFFVPTIERNQAYYSTAQFNDNLGGMDIYHIEFDPHFKGKLAVIEGKVIQNGNAKTIRILVSRADDQQLVGDYRPDPKTGEYLMFLETGQRYAIKEVKQFTIEEVVGEINVSDEMAYSDTRATTQLRDISIEPPLKPTERLLAQNTVVPQTLTKVVDPQNNVGSNTEAVAITAVSTPNSAVTVPSTASSNQMVIPSTISSNPELPTADISTEGYTVQLIALNTKKLKNFNIFKGLDLTQISETKCKDGFYRYTYATYLDKESSLAVRQKIVTELRFKDAFIRPVSQLADLRAEEK